MSKLLEHLQAQKAKREEALLATKHAEAIAENAVKVEAVRAAGPTKQCKFESQVARCIWGYLKYEFPNSATVTFEEERFDEGRMNQMENEVWFSPAKYEPARIKMPYHVSYGHDQVYSEGGRYGLYAKATGNKIVIHQCYDEQRKHFRQLKDGSFKYYEIAQELMRRIRMQHNRALAEQQRKNNVSHVQQVFDNISPPHKSYNGVQVTASQNVDKPVFVKIDLGRAMTVEAATALLNVLKQYEIG